LYSDIQEQLRSADSRCELLDKQLEYMRKMLNEAEAEKRLAYERSEQMMRLRSANTGQELRLQMEKIAGMEREHQRLQASQALAQVDYALSLSGRVRNFISCITSCFRLLRKEVG